MACPHQPIHLWCTKVSSDRDKAQAFNKTYLESSNLNERDHAIDPHDQIKTAHSIPDFVVTEQEVIDQLKIIDPSKAYGPVGVIPRLLKEAGDAIAKPLAKLFNMSLRRGIFPTDWKLANILPIFKKNDPSLTENYRPVSLLSRVGMLF